MPAVRKKEKKYKLKVEKNTTKSVVFFRVGQLEGLNMNLSAKIERVFNLSCSDFHKSRNVLLGFFYRMVVMTGVFFIAAVVLTIADWGM